MATLLSQCLDKINVIPDVQGYLEISSEGAVLASSGDLENDENIAGAITKMLQAAAKMPLSVEIKYRLSTECLCILELSPSWLQLQIKEYLWLRDI